MIGYYTFDIAFANSAIMGNPFFTTSLRSRRGRATTPLRTSLTVVVTYTAAASSTVITIATWRVIIVAGLVTTT